MYCNKCGHNLNKNQNFCDKCGMKVKHIKSNLNFSFMKSKKILLIIIFVILFLIIKFCITTIKESNPKYDPKPSWMLSNSKNFGDYDIAYDFVYELNKKYNTRFHIMGYGYFYNNIDHTYELERIHVYSDEYPQVYVSYCVNGKHCLTNKDTYLDEINSWKQKNLIYDIAKKIDIDTSKIAVHVSEAYEGASISGVLLVNNSIDINTIEKLFSVIKEETNSSIYFEVYFVEKGNNKEYKKHMNGIGLVVESRLDLSFGNWKKYNVDTFNSDIIFEFVSEYK